MAGKRHRLVSARKAAGFSQERLAETVGVERTTVMRWERGETRPQPWARPRLSRALGISDHALSELLGEPAEPEGAASAPDLDVEARASDEARTRFAERLAAADCLGNGQAEISVIAGSGMPEEPVDEAGCDPVLAASWNQQGTVTASVALRVGRSVDCQRFTLLTGTALTAPAHQWLIRDPEPLVSGLSGGRVSAALADQLPAMIATLRAVDDAAGGGTVLSLAQQAFDWVTDLLDHASYDERTGRRLHIALAELGQLTGWVAHDAGRPKLGQRYHVAALRAANSADDRPLGAHILGCMADQAARHGRPAEAVTLIETALVGIRGWETPRLLAELHIRNAYALATLRDGAACIAAVAKARTQVEQFGQDHDPSWLYWVTPAEITTGAGDCLLQLDQPAQAAALLNDGIAMFDESFARDRQIYLTHLADALARPGKQRDFDAAVNRGLAALHLAESLASTRGLECFRDLYRQMQPHALVPAVGNFLERLRGVLAA